MLKGLTIFKDEARNNSVVLDADNAFWGIIKNNGSNGDTVIHREILSLYERHKDRLDSELHNFRFSQDLSAIYIDPTDRCNANCPYCYIPAAIRKNGRSMTKEELGFILKKIKKYFKNKARKPVVIFHASEPLLVKGIIFEAIRNYVKFFKFGLQTNATLLKKKDVGFLKKHRVGVGISLDSSSSSINNHLRINDDGEGNFSKAVDAISWFDGYSGLNVITTVTKFNIAGLDRLVKFLHSKNVPCVLLNPIRLTQKNSLSLKPDTKDLIKYFLKAVDTAIELSEKSRHKIIIGNFANVILGIVAPLARRLMCDISPCGGGRCFFTITASGNMIPCGEFIGIRGFSGGSVFKTSIWSAMDSMPFKKVRARFVEKIAECRECAFRNICGAPCPAELHASGNMNQKSIFCEFYKEVIKYAFRIISEGKEKICLRTEGLKDLRYVYSIS